MRMCLFSGKVYASPRTGLAARQKPAKSSYEYAAKPSSRAAICAAERTAIATKKNPARKPDPLYSRSSAPRIGAGLSGLERPEDRLALCTGFLRPLIGHLLADLLEFGGELRRGLHDLDSARSHRLYVAFVLGFARLPTARLRRRGGIEDGLLIAGIQLAPCVLVHHHHVLRQERLRVVVVRKIIPRLGVHARRARGDHQVDQTRPESLWNIWDLHRRRDRPHQLGQPRGGRAVGTELGPLQVSRRVDFFFGVEALRRPGHGIEQLDTLRIESLLEVGARDAPQLRFLGIAVGDKGVRIEREQG